MRFEFATATRIIFGPGVVREVAPAARAMGKRALLVTGHSGERATGLIEQFKVVGVSCVPLATADEPSVDSVQQGAEFARAEGCDLVIGFGGGSAIDAGKAMAALLANRGELMDYLEVIGQGKPLEHPAAPFIAVPTTAGTGSEVTRNSVLASPQHRVKVSLRSPFMLPRLAVVDPDLTISLPPAVTASTGVDALTQLIEPYVSNRANPLTDGICVEGLSRVARSLRRAYQDGGDVEARQEMSLAALLSGAALANAGLGVVHGFAGPVGGMFPVPHGAAVAALLRPGIEVNLRALRARASGSEALRRYESVARILTGRPNAVAEECVEWVAGLCREMKIPPLGSYGVREGDVTGLVEKASKASSMKGNPIALTPEELREVLTKAL